MEETLSQNKKRLAKNTLLLYIRMLLVMFVTFFTTRVILEKLGVEDYGIYNTIAGVVVMFAFINKAMVTTTQRFLNYYIGRGDEEEAQKHFSLSLVVHAIIAIIIILLGECVGCWFLYNKMSLPIERFEAAFWTLQISIAVTFFNVMRTPYNACIIAQEKMNFYAYISIVEVLLKLIIVYVLSFSAYDKLLLYNLLLLFVSIVVMLLYKLYCNAKYPISRFHYVNDSNSLKSLLNFSSYSLLGNAANAGSAQGVSMILNSFVGVVANASAGVCAQINTGVYSFISNFQVAFNPQLIKTYAQSNYVELKSLICQASKYSYFLMLTLSVPVIFHCESILNLWLTEVPEYTISFINWIIVSTLVTTLEEPLWITVQASGEIRKYQIICCLLISINLPLSYLVLKLGLHPSYVYIGKLIVNIFVYVFRFSYVDKLIDLSLRYYFKNLLLPVVLTSLFVSVIASLVYSVHLEWYISILFMVVTSLAVILMVGIKKKERQFICQLIKKKL